MGKAAARFIVSIALWALVSTGYAGAIKKWTDAHGTVHYGDRPPANAATTDVKIRTGPISTQPTEPLDMSPQAQLDRLVKSRARPAERSKPTTAADTLPTLETCRQNPTRECLRAATEEARRLVADRLDSVRKKPPREKKRGN